MLKRIALIYFGVQFISVSALGSMALAETSTTPPREGGFCVGIVEKLQKIDQKISEQRGELVKKGKDRLPRLEERWQKHIAGLEEKRTQRDANLDQHFAKLEERAKTEVRNLSQDREQAVAAFKTAVLSAIDARRIALKSALDAFHSGVKSALEARRTAIEKAFADRVAAFKAAAEQAKSDCSAGLYHQSTVRTVFTASLKSAQKKFAAARKANDEFKKTMEKLQADKKAAFEKAHNDFKAAIEAARIELKKAFGESNATSTTSILTDSTAGWKTYTNTAHNYSFRYPGDWQLADSPNTSTLSLTADDVAFSRSGFRFGVRVVSVTGCSTLHTCTEANRLSFGTSEQTTGLSETTAGGKSALTETITRPTTGNWKYYVHYILDQGKLYRIFTIAKATDDMEAKPIFDQILSTFTFTQ